VIDVTTAGRPEVAAPATLRQSLAALLLFAVLAAFHTWPLAGSLTSLSRHDNGDAILNEWTIAWVAHQLPRDPLHLFDANIFHPEPNTLAFSEHLFVQSVMGAPLLWAGVPTLPVYNLLVIAGFALTGWTMCLVVRRWTDDWWAGILAGLLLAFNAHSLTRIAHVQALHVQFLPLAMFALDRLLRTGQPRYALGLALMYVLQSLTSNYLLVFITFGLAAAAISRPDEWLARGRGRVLALICAAAALAILLMVPFLLPYLEAQREQGLTRTLDEVARYSASWHDYLYASGRLHYEWWSARFFRPRGAALFPGLTALLLAATTVALGAAWRERRVRMWLAMGLAGLVLSFGAALPGYEYLYRGVPLLQGIRASVRFGYLVLAAVAALAGFGLALMRTRTADRPGLRMALSAAALALVTIEAARLPLGYTRAHRTPRAYVALAEERVNAVVELPLYEPAMFFLNSPYMLHSTVHWKPLLNGYSGFRPESYDRHFHALRDFPDAATLAYLRSFGVTHVAVHAAQFERENGAERLRRIPNTPGLLPVVVSGNNLVIYRLESVDR
jgi:hypothetical protein